MDAVTKHKFSKKTCCSGQIPPTIDTKPCSKSVKSSLFQSTFLGICKERCQDDIGVVNHNWFSSKIQTRSPEDVHQDKDAISGLVKEETDDVEDNQILKEDFTFKTPSRRLYLEKSKQLYSTPILPSPSSSVSTPSFFSPDEHSVSKRKYWNTAINSPQCRLATLSPTTPGSLAFTPNQASTSDIKSPSPYSPSHCTSDIKSPSPYAPSHSTSALKSPSPCAPSQFFTCDASFITTTFDDTPKFMKRLLMKNQPGGKASPLDVSLGLSNKHTSQLVPLSLGMDHEDNLSWTSSLATPPISTSGISGKSSEKPSYMRESSEKHQPVVIARALFTDNNLPNDTWPLDSQNTTDLFDLAKASSDEDEKEMTVENENLEGTLQQQDDTFDIALINENQNETTFKDSQDDVEGLNNDEKHCKEFEETGLNVQLLESEEKHIPKELLAIAPNETNSIRNKGIPEFSRESNVQEIYTEKHDNKDTQNLKLPDSQTLQIVCDLAKQNHLESAAKVEVFPGNLAPPNTMNAPTPPSQVIVNEILLKNKFSPDGSSNIADTLAFLLDTPPERRQKLAKKKPPLKGLPYKQKRKRKRKASMKGNKEELVYNDDLKDTPDSEYAQDSLIEEKDQDEMQNKEDTTHQDSKEDNLTTNNTKQSYQLMCPSNMPEPQEYCVQDNKKDDPAHNSANLGPPVSYNSDGAKILTSSSPRGQVDPFSQISPSFADALCRATDAVSANMKPDVGEQCKKTRPKLIQNKDFILTSASCHPEENRCNILTNGAIVDNLRYNKESLDPVKGSSLKCNIMQDTEAHVNHNNSAGNEDHSGTIPKRNLSKSSFMYPSEMQQKLLPSVSRTGNLFDTFLRLPTKRSCFTYSDEGSRRKEQSPKRFQWMNNATIIKEDSDEENNKGETNKEEGEDNNITSLPTFQEKPRHPIKKDFVTFSSFFDDESKGKHGCDISRNTVPSCLADLKTTPVSRKGKHPQRQYGQSHSKRLRMEKNIDEVAITKNIPDMIQHKELPLISEDSDHSDERNDINEDIPVICNIDSIHISENKPTHAKNPVLSPFGTRINVTCNATLKSKNPSRDNGEIHSRTEVGCVHMTSSVMQKPLELLENVHLDVMPHETEDSLITLLNAAEKNEQPDSEPTIKKFCDVFENVENGKIHDSIMDANKGHIVTKFIEPFVQSNNMHSEIAREDLSNLSNLKSQPKVKQNFSNFQALEDVGNGSGLKSSCKLGGFTFSSGKDVMVSNSSWKKANALIASIDSEVKFAEENTFQHHPLVKTDTNDDFVKEVKEQIDLPSFQPKAKLNYDKQLPNGPEEFKLPAKVEGNNERTNFDKYVPSYSTESQLTAANTEQCKIKRTNTCMYPLKKDSIMAVSETGALEIENGSKAATSKEALSGMLKQDDYLESFDDDFVSATQAEKEIAAADEAEMVYAFMQEEEEVHENLIKEVSTTEKHDISTLSSVMVEEVNDQYKYKYKNMLEEGRVPEVNDRLWSIDCTTINEDTKDLSQDDDTIVVDEGCVMLVNASLSNLPQGYQTPKEEVPTHHHLMANGSNISNQTNDNGVLIGAQTDERSKCNNDEVIIGNNSKLKFASDNKVNVSDKTLWNAQHLLTAVQNDGDERLEEENAIQENTDEITAGAMQSSVNLSNNKQIMNKRFQNVSGFQTAGGVEVAVSDKALRHARGLINQDAPEGEPNLLDHVVPETEQPARKSSDAYGCTVTNSDITLRKRRNMFEEVDTNETKTFQDVVVASDDLFQENCKKPSSRIKNTSSMTGSNCSHPVHQCTQAFLTASGKSVALSKSALQKVREGGIECPAQISAESIPSSNTDNSDKYVASERTLCLHAGSNGNLLNQVYGHGSHLTNDHTPSLQKASSTAPRKQKPFVGFMTGKGEKVNISQDSLKMVKHMFDDEEIASNFLLTETKVVPSTSEPGACLSNCQVPTPGREAISSGKSNIETPFVGFMTGKGKKVNISEDALKKVKQTFDNEDITSDVLFTERRIDTSASKPGTSLTNKNVLSPGDASSSRKPKLEKQFVGFLTGKGRKVNISQNALKKVKLLFDDEEVSSDVFITERRMEISTSKPGTSLTSSHVSPPREAFAGKSNTDKPFIGFMTGKGEKVNISEDSLRKVKQTFDNEEVSSDVHFTETRIESSASKPGICLTNNHVFISREASSPGRSEMGKSFVGFMTGKGEKVKVSEDSLKKVKLDFDDEDVHDDVKNTGRRIDSNVKKPFIGFLTGNGEKVDVSDDSLKNAKSIFEEDISSHVPPIGANKQCIKKPCAGFQTGRGTAVSVSAESLMKARMVLAKEDAAMNLPSESEEDASCSGFLTGRGKQVNISDDTIVFGKKLRCEAAGNVSKENHIDTLHTGSVLGFQTAGGSKVDISDDAIKHARGVLQDQMPSKDCQGLDVPSMSDILLQQELEKMSKSKETSQFRRIRNKTVNPTAPAVPEFKSESKRVTLAGNHVTAPFKPSPENILQDRSVFLPGSTSHIKPLMSQPNCTGYRMRGGKLRSEKITPCRVDPGESSFITPFKEGISSKQPPGPQPSRLFDKPRAYKARGASGKAFVGPFAKKLKLDLSSEKGTGDHQGIAKLQVRSSAGDGDCRKFMRDDQMKRIQAKKNYTVKPQKGSLRQKRQSLERIKLGDLVDGELPMRYTEEEMFTSGVLPSTVLVTAASAEEFLFTGSDHFSEGVLSSGGIQLADGGTLTFDDAGRAGKKEFYNALLDTPGVDPRLVTPEWVYNHYRWIVWKLASMERSYPKQFGGRFLTPESTLLQLKYRYDREIDESQRSAIKMITERDDTPSKTLVLCVAAVHDHSQTSNPPSSPAKLKQPQTTLELTDGWYSIHASIDAALQRLVKTGKLMIGQKIIIHGAELIGSQDACPPLEAPSSLRLKISANSTRRALYDTRLGYRRSPQAFPVLLSSIYADGGMVGCLDVVVARSYPLMYMEKLTEGGSVFRTEKSERKAAADYGRNHQKRMEAIYDKIQSKFENASTESHRAKRRKSLKLTDKAIAALQTGSEIHDAVETVFDPNSIKTYLTTKQLESLEAYRRRLMDKRHADMQAEIQKVIGQENEQGPKRTVTPLLKVRLVDYNLCERSLATSVLLTVWRPSEEVVGLMKEGQRLKVFSVSASAGWSRDGVNQVQLASNRSTRYKDLTSRPCVLDVVYPPREIINFAEIGSEYFQPDYQEMDVVGLVMYATPYNSNGNSSRPQIVYLTDADVNILALKFWGGMKAFFVEEIMEPGSFVCISNLQWKGRDKRSRIACVYVNEMTVITQNPRMKHLKDALQHLKEQIKDPKSFISLNQGVLEELSSIVHEPQTPVTPYIKPSLPPPLPVSTPRIQGTRKVGNTRQFTPSPSAFQIPQAGRTSTKQGHALQTTTPVVPKNKLTTPKSQDFRSYYSKRLYSKEAGGQPHTTLTDQTINQDNQQRCGQVETPRTSGQHQRQVKTSRTPLVSTPVHAVGVTFPLFNKKTLITPKSQNFSSYYKNNASTAKSSMCHQQTTPSSRGHLISTPMSAKKEKQLLMNSIRFETLSRIPSPPPLEPLTNSQSSVLAQSYKKPLDVLETPKRNMTFQESSDMDDLELQALDAGFSNRTLALEDSGDFDFSEASPEKMYCQNEDTRIKDDDVETNLSWNHLENTSCLSQISDIPTQVLRDLDLSGLEEIASSASSVAAANNDRQDSVHQTSTMTQLSETMEREIDAMEETGAENHQPVQNTSNVTSSQGDEISCRRKRKRDGDSKRGMFNECFELSQEVASLQPKDTISLLHLHAEFRGSSRRVTRSISKKVLEK